MSIRLVTHSRHALRAAWAAGQLDDATYSAAASLMDDLGVPDGAQVAYSGEDWDHDLQGWLDQMPLRYSTATRRKFALHAARFADSIREDGLDLSDVDEFVLAAWAQRRQTGRAGGTWAQEEMALTSLFSWLSSPDNPTRIFEQSPWPMWRTGSRTRSRLAAGPRTLSREVRMLDAEQWRCFRNSGLAGLDGGRIAAPRFPDRDVALGDLLVTTGMRLEEARCLLIDEVPQVVGAQRQRPWPNTMLFAGGERAKTRGGWVPFLPEVGDRIWDWWESDTRQAIVAAAQVTLRKALRSGLLFVVEEVRIDRGVPTFRGEWLGSPSSWTADKLPATAAQAAVRLDAKQITPLTLWQTDANGGGPMSGSALRTIFAEATMRAAAAPGHVLDHDMLRSRVDRGGTRQITGGITPHMARHTAAVNWLVELISENRRRADNLVPTPHAYLPSSGAFDPMLYVRTWLRHVDEATTRQYQTWVHRHDWPTMSGLGLGVRALVSDSGLIE